MPSYLDKPMRRVQTILAGFSTGQKAVTALGLVALVLGGILFSSWASKPTFVPLFTNLTTADAAAITEKLGAQKTPYQLADGGRSVLVPQKDVYQLRLDVSSAGLPQGGESGYALLDKQGITTSEFQQHVEYQRALEGELAKTIGAIDGVDGTIVHLVIPTEDVFANHTRKPSASVLIKTKPGKTLAPGQVQAVVHLVSASVEGLTPEQVTVADAKGQVLSTAGPRRSHRGRRGPADPADPGLRGRNVPVGAGHAHPGPRRGARDRAGQRRPQLRPAGDDQRVLHDHAEHAAADREQHQGDLHRGRYAGRRRARTGQLRRAGRHQRWRQQLHQGLHPAHQRGSAR